MKGESDDIRDDIQKVKVSILSKYHENHKHFLSFSDYIIR